MTLGRVGGPGPCAVEQEHERDALGAGQLGNPESLGGRAGPDRAAQYREVFSPDRHHAPIETADPCNQPIRRRSVRRTHQNAKLAKGSWVAQRVDPGSGVESTPEALTGQPGRPAHRTRRVASTGQIFEEGLPTVGHGPAT